MNGKTIGYCSKKSKLQSRIDEYIENGDGENKNIAFVQIDDMPTYELCLLKRGITTNDEEIFQEVIKTGTTYYRYYAILENSEEKYYVSDFNTADEVVQTLKDKDSKNMKQIYKILLIQKRLFRIYTKKRKKKKFKLLKKLQLRR